MQTLTQPEAVVRTKFLVERHSARLAHLLAFVPDDKLAWPPAPQSRSALVLANHSALSNGFFAQILTGTLPNPVPTPEEFFRNLHEAEAEPTTREHVLSRFNESTTELLAALDTVQDLEAPRNSPFGPFPAAFWLDQSAEHLAYHAAQLAYLQTTWGDLDNHLS